MTNPGQVPEVAWAAGPYFEPFAVCLDPRHERIGRLGAASMPHPYLNLSSHPYLNPYPYPNLVSMERDHG